MRQARLAATLVLATVATASPLASQASLYGVLGVGMPGQAVGIRARALGSGPLAFDVGSAVNPAAVGLLGPLTVAASATTSLRTFSTGETVGEGLRQTRFLYGMVGGRIARTPFSFAVSFAPYLDRTSDIASTDTIVLRGSSVEVQDRLVTDGGVSDLRGAVGWRLARRLQLGAAVHILSGSTRLRAVREFSDSAFVALRDSSQASFSGLGVSLGANLVLSRRASIGLAVRSDTRLDRSIDSVTVAGADLPVTVTGGIAFAPLRALRLTTSAMWRNWSTADVEGTQSFDTWEVGAGIEIGGPDIGASRVPLRLGMRFATLPFSPSADQPREWVASGGTAYPFAGNRALVEAAVERIFRDGGGASERVWQLSFGLLLVP